MEYIAMGIRFFVDCGFHSTRSAGAAVFAISLLGSIPSVCFGQRNISADRALVRRLLDESTPPKEGSTIRGSKQYELTNHLGNVLATISDQRIVAATPQPGTSRVTADLITASDYYAFGMEMPGRIYAPPSLYRYGFNGKENDNELEGDGNQQDYGMRIYDPRSARFLSVDPISKEYPELTPYQFASNSPIQNIDKDGLEKQDATAGDDAPKKKHFRLVTHADTYQSAAYIHLVQVRSSFYRSEYGSIFKRPNGSKVRKVPHHHIERRLAEVRVLTVTEDEQAVYIKRTTKILGMAVKSHVSVYAHGKDIHGNDKTEELIKKRNGDKIDRNDIVPGTEYQEQYRKQLQGQKPAMVRRLRALKLKE